MVEQLARFLGVSCDKAQLESLIEHCHQLVDQCCNAEALPVGRGMRPPGPGAPAPSLPASSRFPDPCPPPPRAPSQGSASHLQSLPLPGVGGKKVTQKGPLRIPEAPAGISL